MKSESPILMEHLDTLRDKYKLNDFLIGFFWGAYRGFNGIDKKYKDGSHLIKFETFLKLNN